MSGLRLGVSDRQWLSPTQTGYLIAEIGCLEAVDRKQEPESNTNETSRCFTYCRITCSVK